MAAIDVLMPMRDAAPWVAAAWRSLARQTRPDWRLIAVDDGSRDGSVEVLDRAAAGDPRLHLVEAPRRGVAAALNCALAEVRAPLAARMDADDLSHPRRLELLAAELERAPSCGAVGSRVRLFPAARVSPAMHRYLAWQNTLLSPAQLRAERYVECTLTHASVVFRSAVLTAAGGWWEGPGPEDLDLFLRLHAAGVAFRKVPRTLYLWREHPNRETRTSPRCSPEAFRAVKCRHLSRELSGAGRPVALFGRGRSLARWAGLLEDAGVAVAVREYRRPPSPGDDWTGLALFCFGSPGVRARIRRALAGRLEGRDYLFVS